MDVFLYFSDRLPVALDELEDTLDRALQGVGEVTGSGTGEMGSNIDVLVKNENLSKTQVVELVRKALTGLDLPQSSRIVIEDERFPIG
jgi:hypothetical protein